MNDLIESRARASIGAASVIVLITITFRCFRTLALVAPSFWDAHGSTQLLGLSWLPLALTPQMGAKGADARPMW